MAKKRRRIGARQTTICENLESHGIARPSCEQVIDVVERVNARLPKGVRLRLFVSDIRPGARHWGV